MLTCQLVDTEAEPYIDFFGKLKNLNCSRCKRLLISNNRKLAIQTLPSDFLDHVSEKLNAKGLTSKTINKVTYLRLPLVHFGINSVVWIHVSDLTERLHFNFSSVLENCKTIEEISNKIKDQSANLTQYYDIYENILKVTQFQPESVAKILSKLQDNPSPFAFYSLAKLRNSGFKSKSRVQFAPEDDLEKWNEREILSDPPLEELEEGVNGWQFNLYRVVNNKLKHQLFRINETFSTPHSTDSAIFSSHPLRPRETLFKFDEMGAPMFYKCSEKMLIQRPLQNNPYLKGINNSIKKLTELSQQETHRGIESLPISIHAFDQLGENIGTIGYLTPAFEETLEDFTASPKHPNDPELYFVMIDQLVSAVSYLHRFSIFHLLVLPENITMTHENNPSSYQFVLRNFDYAYTPHQIIDDFLT
ncbi:MAG: hypothetical protein KDK40_03655, partial [Chlamydiia bacterium]|nr:hypothetical protein [Chlamydiia bacterium]